MKEFINTASEMRQGSSSEHLTFNVCPHPLWRLSRSRGRQYYPSITAEENEGVAS